MNQLIVGNKKITKDYKIKEKKKNYTAKTKTFMYHFKVITLFNNTKNEQKQYSFCLQLVIQIINYIVI